MAPESGPVVSRHAHCDHCCRASRCAPGCGRRGHCARNSVTTTARRTQAGTTVITLKRQRRIVTGRRAGRTDLRSPREVGHEQRVVRDGGRGPATGQEAVAEVGLRRPGGRFGEGDHHRGERHRLQRAGFRPARGRVPGRPGSVHLGHGSGHLSSGRHLAHRRPGRAPRRRSGHGPGRRRPGNGHGPQLVCQHGRGGRGGGQPQDLLPDLLGR